MKLNLMAIRNLVEFNMRFYKIHGYDPKTKPKYDNTIPPEQNNKPPEEINQWAVSGTLAMGADGKIAVNIKNDNNTNMRDMISQCIYDVLTDVIASPDPSKLSISGQKFTDKDGNETIIGKYYGGGGDKTSPGLGNFFLELDPGKTFIFKVGAMMLKFDSANLWISPNGGLGWLPVGIHTHPFIERQPDPLILYKDVAKITGIQNPT